jgi:dihydrofolate synthase/folylpolyglutamate synthase
LCGRPVAAVYAFSVYLPLAKAYNQIMAQLSALDVLQEWLDSYINFEKKPEKNIFWLDTMTFLCNRFGNPQNSCPSFHVAGSKGKGSVSAMISSILTEAGYSCGLYTSPHVVSFNERVRLAHRPFPEKIYEAAVRELEIGVDSIIPDRLPGNRPITWFELVTLFAFLTFRQAHVDRAVYEVGMGGRLDSTNVITPVVSVITPIELEHTEYLGDTIEKIAAEKAGIIKKGIPVFSAPQKESVRDVFRQKAKQTGTECIFVDTLLKKIDINYGKNLKTKKTVMDVYIESPLFSRPLSVQLGLLGTFQGYNAVLAAAAVKKVYPEIDESILESGLAAASLPGRFEPVTAKRHPGIVEIILDGAHTINSVTVTLQTFRKLFENRRADLLVAFAADKKVENIVPLFGDTFSRITVTRPGSEKKSDLPRLQEAFRQAGFEYQIDSDYKKAINEALDAADREHGVLLVIGSFYLVAEVKKILAAENC